MRFKKEFILKAPHTTLAGVMIMKIVVSYEMPGKAEWLLYAPHKLLSHAGQIMGCCQCLLLIHPQLFYVNKDEYDSVNYWDEIQVHVGNGSLFSQRKRRHHWYDLASSQQVGSSSWDSCQKYHQNMIWHTTTTDECMSHLYERPSGPVNVRFLQAQWIPMCTDIIHMDEV